MSCKCCCQCDDGPRASDASDAQIAALKRRQERERLESIEANKAADREVVKFGCQLVALVCCVIAAIVFMIADARAQVHVSDGDTLKLNGTTYRLWGIDAPEKSQVCDNGFLAGLYAAAVLRGLVDKRFVICIPRTTDRYGRTVAICLADGVDVGAEMVRQGMAWAYTRYSVGYADLEAAAKAEGLGVHGAGCQQAWNYRKEKHQ